MSELGIALLSACLAGAIVLTVLKEELPAERESRVWPFVVGVVLRIVLLMQ